MKAQPLPHFYRLHDNGWISIVTQRGAASFTSRVAREGEGAPAGASADLRSAQRLADSAIPMAHSCSNRCTSWFEVSDPSRTVDFTTTCPRQHSGSLSYMLGDVLLRLNTLSFWCLQCGRSWPATDEQRLQLVQRMFETLQRAPDARRAG